MREDQIEALEKAARRYFPKGFLICAVMPNGALHTTTVCGKDKEYEELLYHLATHVVAEYEQLQNLYDEDDEQDGAVTEPA